MEYYYSPKEKINIDCREIEIDDFEFKHLTKVLRKREGDRVTVTDGERNIYQCSIIKIEKSRIVCKINSEDYNLNEPDASVTLYISPLRNPSRFEFAIEKAVELGVYKIIPVITDFTVSKSEPGNAKIERIKKIMIGAMGQSQRCYLPELSSTISFNEMIEREKESKNKIVMYEYSGDRSESIIESEVKEISLLIGPEGGFSKREISSLSNSSWQIKSLGERKLRAETAAIVSLFEIISKNSSFKKT